MKEKKVRYRLWPFGPTYCNMEDMVTSLIEHGHNPVGQTYFEVTPEDRTVGEIIGLRAAGEAWNQIESEALRLDSKPVVNKHALAELRNLIVEWSDKHLPEKYSTLTVGTEKKTITEELLKDIKNSEK